MFLSVNDIPLFFLGCCRFTFSRVLCICYMQLSNIYYWIELVLGRITKFNSHKLVMFLHSVLHDALVLKEILLSLNELWPVILFVPSTTNTQLHRTNFQAIQPMTSYHLLFPLFDISLEWLDGNKARWEGNQDEGRFLIVKLLLYFIRKMLGLLLWQNTIDQNQFEE